jgi:CRISPR-associated protein (TIGR03984 family)
LEGLPADQAGLESWLIHQAKENNLTYALVHADDGVIWGRFTDGRWSWSSDSFSDVSPKLSWVALQQMRVFGPKAEVFIWREAGVFRGRLIQEDGSGEQKYFDEAQLLWGKPDGEARDGFRLMREGAQGLLHAPPVEIATRGRLMTRNYIDYDQDGCALVKASRLVAEQER